SYYLLTLYAFSLSSLRILYPPSSTLFPYTTLFRSHRHLISARNHVVCETGSFSLTACLSLCLSDAHLSSCCRRITKTSSHVVSLDRKSTRLNSSHVSISYAVFCLKKKI